MRGAIVHGIVRFYLVCEPHALLDPGRHGSISLRPRSQWDINFGAYALSGCLRLTMRASVCDNRGLLSQRRGIKTVDETKLDRHFLTDP